MKARFGASSCTAKAWPQWATGVTSVMVTTPEGMYRPAPAPMRKTQTAKPGKVSHSARPRRPRPMQVTEATMVPLCPSRLDTKPARSTDRLYPPERQTKRLALAARLRPRWSEMGSSRGPKRVLARKLAKKTVVSSARGGRAGAKGAGTPFFWSGIMS